MIQEEKIELTEKTELTAGEKVKELQKELTWSFPNIAKEAPSQKEEAFEYCEAYKAFLDCAKTEREFTQAAVKLLNEAGYAPFEKGRDYKAGDKVYYVNRKKSLIMTTFGQREIGTGVRLNVAHIDSPRLDLKPNPMYEKAEMAFFKTHYYGGIRKYQWAAIPLAMHGVVVKKDGEITDIRIGEEEGDPVFCVTDLLPHLAADQNERKLKDGIKGEELNVIIGSLPFSADEDIKEPVKLLALSVLNEKYGMTEKDFIRAEIEIVPAFKAVDVGLDRSMVGAYGQDDRVCAYTALTAEMASIEPEYTTVTVLADKEEIGSVGNTGLDSDFVLHYIEDLAETAGIDYRTILRNSICLSSDVNAAYDPTFSQVYEERNACYINKGCVLTKYTGSRGKGGSNDASAETMAKIVDMMDREGVYWQIGELGAVDVGGGGTVAMYVAGMDVDVVDLGVPILSMHSPFELASKLDIYNTYKAFCAFYK
ncbi:aminopeptidase [[Clostridium] symbiosum]|uniref:aminopeptidase n=1 Tax=Clostridium symbiosum TaxID=1512 RepID=UPI00192429F8|nr:aminopeptidase [[Clostridium] symbiosum]MDB2031038.1 aminopeptidase [[Clostridium] symbiosum]